MLPQLRELDLRNNYLDRIPSLKELPLLRSLNISNNKVQIVKLVIQEQNFRNLERLDLQNNQITFSEGKTQINDFIEKLDRFKSLKFLALNGNPFASASYMDEIAANLPNCIETFNNSRIQQVRQALVMKKIENDDLITDRHLQNNSKISKKRDKSDYVPTLDTFCHVLEQANNHPSKALDYLKILF